MKPATIKAFNGSRCAANGCMNSRLVLPHGGEMSYYYRHLTPELRREYLKTMSMNHDVKSAMVHGKVKEWQIVKRGRELTVNGSGASTPLTAKSFTGIMSLIRADPSTTGDGDILEAAFEELLA